MERGALCPACTDIFWACVAWRLRDHPHPGDPVPDFPLCAACAAGWLGRVVAEMRYEQTRAPQIELALT